MVENVGGEIKVNIITTEEGSVTTSGVQRAGAPGAGGVPMGAFGPAAYFPPAFVKLTPEQKQELAFAEEAVRIQNEALRYNKLVLGVAAEKQDKNTNGMWDTLKEWLPLIGGSFGIGMLIRQSKIINTVLSSSLTILGTMVDIALMPFLPAIVSGLSALASLIKPWGDLIKAIMDFFRIKPKEPPIKILSPEQKSMQFPIGQRPISPLTPELSRLYGGGERLVIPTLNEKEILEFMKRYRSGEGELSREGALQSIQKSIIDRRPGPNVTITQNFSVRSKEELEEETRIKTREGAKRGFGQVLSDYGMTIPGF
ncbi:hypothetical protein HYS94_01550 [Candidatus Daviesbacteria bacterium]|nr:hypothetical protein [Candidatus Daviesbacteria bacterium]